MTITAEPQSAPAPQGVEHPALSARGVTVRFGGLLALDDVTIEVPHASVFGIIGPNGAGKSTLLGVLSGLLKTQHGTVRIEDEDVTDKTPHVRARLGLSRTFQRPDLFVDLSVMDHLVIAYRMRHDRSRMLSDLCTGKGLRPSRGEEADRVTHLANLLGLTPVANVAVGSLPLGSRRLLEFGRSLAMRPTILLADEPFSGLNTAETARVAQAVRELVTKEKVAMVLVEHDIELVFDLCASISVLDFGKCIVAGSPAVVRADQGFQAAYLGNAQEALTGAGDPTAATSAPVEIDEQLIASPEVADELAAASLEAHESTNGTGTVKVGEHASASSASGERAIDVVNLSVGYGPALALSDISLHVDHGEAVAVLGANGAGKSTLCRTLSGLVPAMAGTVTFYGRDLKGMPADAVRRLGLVYVPEERGIFPHLSVNENLRMAVTSLPRKDRQEALDTVTGMFPVLGKRGRQMAGSLSGGEQQMLSLGRALATSPQVLIADELSLGLAPLIVDVVFEGLEHARKMGISLIVVEQFAARALGFCDRAYIFRRGKIVWQGTSSAAGAEVVHQYLGAEVG